MSNQFLVSPELFPARISGETWGAERVSLDLAGEIYAVEGLSVAQASGLEERYGPRLHRTDPRTPAAVIIIFRAPTQDFVEIDTRGWEYHLDIQWNRDTVTMTGMHLMARADLAGSRVGLWTCVEEPGPFWEILENVLRPILAARLLASGGLLVHSAAVSGWLFPSPSGGGKSTIAGMGLRAGLPVLSDDLNAIVRIGDRLVMMPLPFTGNLAANDLSSTPAALEAIVALEKGDRQAMRPLPFGEAVSLLIRCAPYVNHDKHRTDLLLDRATEIAGAIPCSVLTFQRHHEGWPILPTHS